MPQNSFLIRWLRLTRVGLLVLSGVATVFFLFPFLDERQRSRRKQVWSATLLAILNIQVDASLPATGSGCLIVANHVSWLDIFVINAVWPAAFVSKAEVRRWPVIGWLAATNDTVFLRRGSRGHAHMVNAEIGEKLRAGTPVAVFPEGTTTDGQRLLSFHSALIQPALLAGCPVVPLALSYWESDDTRSLAPRYDGQITFTECLRSIASRPELRACLRSLPALGLDGEDRRQVSRAAHASIQAALLTPAAANRNTTTPLSAEEAWQEEVPSHHITPA